MRNNLLRKTGYGLGDMASSMFWKIFSYYLPFFYPAIFGISLVDAGILVFVTRIWDAISDPMMGIITDRTKSRWGRFRPWLLWIAAPFAICGILLFTTPEWNYTGKLIWAYVTYLMMMTVYTAINVPYGALISVITIKPEEKTVYASFRMFFAYGGSFIALMAWEPLCTWFSTEMGMSLQGSWQSAMIMVALGCMALFLACFGMTKEVVTTSPSESGIMNDFKTLVSNRPWLLLVGASLAFNFFATIRGATIAFFFADVIGEGVYISILAMSVLFYAGLFLGIGEIANMIGVILAVPMALHFGKKSTYIIVCAIMMVLSVCFFFMPLTPAGYVIMIILQILISLCTGVMSPLMWSMYADVADYSELKNGVCSTGLIFSSSSMAQKFGGALSGAAVLWILGTAGYDTSAMGGGEQNASALRCLWYLMSFIPAFIALLAIAIMSRYPLTTERTDEISIMLSKYKTIKTKQ